MRAAYFLPLGLVVTSMSALVGATGPVENPFYLNYGLDKEAMIATKIANSLVAGIVQIVTYFYLGVFPRELWGYSIAIGIAAVAGSYLGKRLLGRMDTRTFRRIVVSVMVVSGVILILRAPR
jgi:hypothetical protein